MPFYFYLSIFFRCLFNSLCDKQEVCLKYFCCIPKYFAVYQNTLVVSRKSTWATTWVISWTRCVFYPETSILLDRMRDKPWLFRLGPLKSTFSKTKSAYRLQENNGQYLVSVVKFKLSKHNQNFENFYT